MAKHSTQNVGTAAALLNIGRTGNQTFGAKSVTLKPTATITVGGPGVTVAAGLDIAAGATVTLAVDGPLWAIAPVATTVKVLC